MAFFAFLPASPLAPSSIVEAACLLRSEEAQSRFVADLARARPQVQKGPPFVLKRDQRGWKGASTWLRMPLFMGTSRSSWWSDTQALSAIRSRKRTPQSSRSSQNERGRQLRRPPSFTEIAPVNRRRSRGSAALSNRCNSYHEQSATEGCKTASSPLPRQLPMLHRKLWR